MTSIDTIEGYFKAKSSFLVCKHSSIHPATITKSAYSVMSAKFEVALQQELNDLLNKYEEDNNVDTINLLNRLLQISDKARLLFMEINDPHHSHLLKSGKSLDTVALN